MKILSHIPNAVTCLNLLSGIAGLFFCFQLRLDLALGCMLAAAAFDFLDGLTARLLKAGSAIGKELDSLCDVVSFGVLPAVMMVKLMESLTWSDSWTLYLPLVIAVAAALRLARFNVDARQTDSFRGLPTPAAALLLGALAYYVVKEPYGMLAGWAGGMYFIPCLCAVLAGLMLSDIPMFSFKLGHGSASAASAAGTDKCCPTAACNRATVIRRVALLATAVLSIVACLIFSVDLSLSLVVTFLVYILLNLF